MKPRFILPVLAAAAATGGAFFTLQAQDVKPKVERKFEFKFNGDPANAGQMKEQLRKMMEQMDPGGEGLKQLDEALRGWETQDQAKPGEPKQFRFEFRNEGSGPKLFRNGKEVKPGDGEDPLQKMQEEMKKEMEEMMRKHLGEGKGGEGGANPMEELMKQLRERGGKPGEGGLQDLFKNLNQAQGGQQKVSRYGKHHRSVLAEWRPLAKTARESTIRIMKDDSQIAFGTIVSADGYALTKASEVEKVKEGLEVEFHDGRIVSAKVVDKLPSYDLALIKLEVTGLTPANFAPHDATVGTLVAAVGVDEDPMAVGVISVPARSLQEKSKGALGIQIGQHSGTGIKIDKVVANCPAAKAGLKDGDIILAINGTTVNYPAELQKMVSSMKPGDTVKVRYTNGSEEKDAEFTLTSREELMNIQREAAIEEFKKQNPGAAIPPAMNDRRMLDPTAQMGSSLSANASGYPNAVQSDLTIDANDCGGPVVDVDGHVVAIAIARSERVSTYMIPGKVVKELLTNVQEGKFTLAKDADTLKTELRDYETAIKKAQDAMKEAEARRAEAEEALKKLQK
jgi:serine protease Do